MESNDIRFKHIGLSSDGMVVFCEMNNGKTYAMPLFALERAEEWDSNAKPVSARIIHDGYAAVVEFDSGAGIDFPSDFVRDICEPSYHSNGNGRTAVSIGKRIREMRGYHGLTLDALADKCGIAKPNLSRLEHDKVTPRLDTLKAIAAALDTPLALLVQKERWPWTRQAFAEWKHSLFCDENFTDPASVVASVRAAELVDVFLANRPEHKYARSKLLKYVAPRPSLTPFVERPLDAKKWAAAKAAREHAKRRID